MEIQQESEITVTDKYIQNTKMLGIFTTHQPTNGLDALAHYIDHAQLRKPTAIFNSRHKY